jgi:hypothetical protein
MSLLHIRQNKHLRRFCRWCGNTVLFLLIIVPLTADAGEKLLIQLRDFTQVEVKSGGFTLPSTTQLHIQARGGGNEKSIIFSTTQMYAYGWIIDAHTREPVWTMDRSNTTRQKDDRTFDGDISLPRGSYEIYFTAYAFVANSGFSTFSFNIDRRKDSFFGDKQKQKGFFSWLDELFGNDFNKEWKHRSKDWGIDVSVDNQINDVTTFSPPKEFSNILYQAVRLGENEHIKQGFIVSKPISIRIYALGEIDGAGNLADCGWVVNAQTHKRVWEMKRNNLESAGGADKNVKFDGIVGLTAGEYILYFNTDRKSVV